MSRIRVHITYLWLLLCISPINEGLGETSVGRTDDAVALVHPAIAVLSLLPVISMQADTTAAEGERSGLSILELMRRQWAWLLVFCVLFTTALAAVLYVLRLNRRLRALTETLRAELQDHAQTAMETRRLGTLVEYASDAVLGLSEEGIVESCNHAALDLYGYTREDLLGKRWQDLFPEVEYDRARVHLQACLQGRPLKAWETKRLTSCGDSLPVSITLSPVPGGKNRRGASSIERDISLRLAAERRQQEAVRLAEESTRYASVGVIASGITHEINQPLNAISLSSEGMLLWERQHPGKLPVFIVDMAERISEAVDRIGVIVEHLRSYWAKTGPDDRESFDMRTVVSSSLSMLERRISNHQITLDYTPHDAPVMATGIALSLEQAVNNLLTHSIHALDDTTETDKRIHMELIHRQDGVRLAIRHNGSKPTVRQPADLFDPFLAASHGRGLTLPIARSLVDAGGGVLEVDLSVEGRTEYLVHLKLEE
ncbi:PAS domain S-box protein [bacterium]|nr:PAS domain S-box protein [bacterium]